MTALDNSTFVEHAKTNFQVHFGKVWSADLPSFMAYLNYRVTFEQAKQSEELTKAISDLTRKVDGLESQLRRS